MNGQSGVCRQLRCCLPGKPIVVFGILALFLDNNPSQNCLANERNTGQQCWNTNQCSFGSVWGAATCRNGFCCESSNTNINQSSPACDQGVAVSLVKFVVLWT